jgi:hypothetical protein
MKPKALTLSIAVALSICIPGWSFCGSDWNAEPDEVLLLIPSESVEQVEESTTPPLQFLFRLPDGYVAGCTREALDRFVRTGASVLVLDDKAGTDTYALVSRHRGSSGDRAYPADIRILYSTEGLDLIKGSPAAFDLIRRSGYVVVEKKHREFTPRAGRLHMPRNPVILSDTVTTLISLVSNTSCSTYTQRMQDFQTRQWSRTNRDSVFNWVAQRFFEVGITDVVLDSFQYAGTWQKNVVATIEGTVHPESEIIVGGHLDSQNYSNPDQAPGADDNATGTVAAIEMARVLKLANYQPAFTLRFIGFAAEEAGLIGSDVYAGRARQENRDIKVMMNYDMLGYRNQGSSDRDFYIVWYQGSEAFSDLHAAAARTYTTLTPIFTTSYRGSSDSWSFYQEGYSTLFCIEYDFNPYYHGPLDLLQYLDVPYAADIVRSGLAMLLILDQMPEETAALDVLDVGNGSSLFTEWQAVEGLDITGYNISIGVAPGAYDTTYFQTEVSRTFTGLTEGTTYFVGVSAVDLVGREGLIVERAGVPWIVPRPPLGLVTEQVPSGLRLLWRENRELDLDGYNIYRSADSLGTYTVMTPSLHSDTTWIDTSDVPVVYYYYVTASDVGGNESVASDTVSGTPTTFVDGGANEVPGTFTVSQNYPNPFNSSTTIVYDVPQAAKVRIGVMNVLGEEVAVLVDEEKLRGRHLVYWNTQEIASGVYFYTVRAGHSVRTRKAILIK